MIDVKFKRIIFIILLLIEYGCASKYVIPESGPTASIRFITTGPAVNVFTAHEEGCSSGVYSISTLGSMWEQPASEHTRIDMPLAGTEDLASNNYSETKIPAGKPFVIYFRQFDMNTICHFSVSFSPKKDSYYEALSIREGNKCSAEISELINNGEGSYIRIEEKSIKKHEQQCNF